MASTVVDLTGDVPRVLREGAVPLDRLRDVVGAVEDASVDRAEPVPGIARRPG